MNKKTTARRTTKRKKRTTRKTAARNAAPAVSGRKYELVGLVLFVGAEDTAAGETEFKLAQTIAAFLGRHMEG